MKITFANKSTLEVETFGTDAHDNLVIELVSEDYQKVKKVIMNENATAKIQSDDDTYTGYTVVKSLTTSIDNMANTHFKIFLIKGGNE